MEAYLPTNCYRDKFLKPQAIVIHYFSCINVDPEHPFDLLRCHNLMLDLNFQKKNRMTYLKSERDPNTRMYASAHCFIGREGELWLTVPENKQAYHAGVSSYKGRSNWNQFSYGVELIGHGTSKFTEEQYQTCAKHCASLMSSYDIGLDWVVGHEDIAPGRKVDPGIAVGNFDMKYLKKLISKRLK